MRPVSQSMIVRPGLCAEQGSHDELRQAGGPYQRMWEDDDDPPVSQVVIADGRAGAFYLHSGDETRPRRGCNGASRWAEIE